MKNSIRTLGISLILLTASLSANSALADVNDDLNLSCNLPENGSVSIRWKAQNNDQVSSYKIYVSDPLSQADCYSSDPGFKYQEDSSKLYAANTEYVLKDLVKGKFYCFKLEAYKDDKLVKSDRLISLIPDKNYGSKLDEEDLFDTVCLIDQNTAKIKWENPFKSNVKKSLKFYTIEDNGLKEIGTADLAAESYTFEKLEANKQYYIAAEVLSGDKTEYSCQFGFTTDYSEPQKITEDTNVKELVVDLNDTTVEVRKEGKVSKDKETGDYSSEMVSVDTASKDCKIFVSEPMSCQDYHAHTDFKNYMLYAPLDHFVACDKETGFDQVKICKNIRSGKVYGSEKEDMTPDIKITDLDPEMYYSIRAEEYSEGKLIASGSKTYPFDRGNSMFFSDGDAEDYETVRTLSKDGKTVNLTWKDLDFENEVETVYIYLSDPIKNRKKVYGEDFKEVSAKYLGKADYEKGKFKLKGLTPDRHYVLYLEAHGNGKIKGYYTYRFSTTPRIFWPENNITNTGSLKLYTDTADYSHSNFWSDWYTNGCISPEAIEYYKKDKSGKYRLIGTSAAGKSFIDKDISLGKSYAYKARSYAVIDGEKVYSEFSPALKTRIENIKPKLKISIVDKKKRIVKISSDKNNGELSANGYYYEQNFSYGYDGKTFNKKGIVIKPGKTVYLKMLKKKKINGIQLTYDLSCSEKNRYYDMSLDFNRSSFKFVMEKQ